MVLFKICRRNPRKNPVQWTDLGMAYLLRSTPSSKIALLSKPLHRAYLPRIPYPSTEIPSRRRISNEETLTNNPQNDSRTPTPIHEPPNTRKSKYSFLEKLKIASEEKEEAKKEGEKKPEEEEAEEGEEAEEIFKRMKEKGLVPNAVAMLDGLCKDGLFKEALEVFGKMREKGTFPEVVVYTAVVEGFCRARRREDAKRVFRKMKEKGVTPNAYSYGVLVRGLCVGGGGGGEAMEVCVEMVERGHSPNMETFVGLVRCLCEGEKGVEGGRDGVRLLLEKGFFLDEKVVRDHLEKKGPFLPLVWEAIFGKRKRNAPMMEEETGFGPSNGINGSYRI